MANTAAAPDRAQAFELGCFLVRIHDVRPVQRLLGDRDTHDGMAANRNPSTGERARRTPVGRWRCRDGGTFNYGVRDKAEEAYARSDLFEKPRELMES